MSGSSSYHFQTWKTVQRGELINTPQGPVRYECMCDKTNEVETIYCKYIYQGHVHDPLVYEFIVAELARFVGLLTPRTAIVNIDHDYVLGNKVKEYHPKLYESLTAFGSINVNYTDVIKEEAKALDKNGFSQLINPLDFVKILVFDTWLDNWDRKMDNSNLLYSAIERNWYVFDHYDCFGGTGQIGAPNPSKKFFTDGMFFRTKYGSSIFNQLSKQSVVDEIERVLSLIADNITLKSIVENTILHIPSEWELSDNIESNLVQFLTDSERKKRLRTYLLDELILSVRLKAP